MAITVIDSSVKNEELKIPQLEKFESNDSQLIADLEQPQVVQGEPTLEQIKNYHKNRYDNRYVYMDDSKDVLTIAKNMGMNLILFGSGGHGCDLTKF